MMIEISRSTILTALSAVAIAAPLSATVQAEGRGDIERAREIRAMAYELSQNIDDVDEFGETAALYREAAELFGETAEAAEAWAQAGHFAFYDRDDRAVEYFRKAGEIATSYGDVAVAARAYLDGAWVANRSGEGAVALEMAERGQRLAESPLLAESEREDLERRIREKVAEIAGLV
jgi:hypothetical protein